MPQDVWMFSKAARSALRDHQNRQHCKPACYLEDADEHCRQTGHARLIDFASFVQLEALYFWLEIKAIVLDKDGRSFSLSRISRAMCETKRCTSASL